MKYISVIFSFIMIPVLLSAESFSDFRNDAYTVALYYLEGNADDETTNNNDGTINGSAASIQFGKFGQAYVFDGVDKYISVPDDTSISGLSAVTVEVWMLITTMPSNNTYPAIIAKSNWSGNREYRIRLERRDSQNSNHIVWHVSSNGADSEADECRYHLSNFSTDTWYYVVGTYSSATDILNLYVDGALVDTDIYLSSSLYDGSGNLGIGAYGDGNPGGYYFQGKLDSVRISNSVRSDQEIRDYYRMIQGIILESQ